jgi:uncharacterized membrane protein YhhN
LVASGWVVPSDIYADEMTMLRLPTAPRPARGGRGKLLRRLLAAAFGVCAVADLVCEAAGWDTGALVFRSLVVPLLIGVLLASRPPLDRTIVLLVIALLFSWLGDTAGGAGFLIKIALFLVAQWFFAAAFWPYRRRSLVTKPLGVLAYAAALIVIVLVLIRPADELAVPLVIYGLSLTSMAILATGLNRRTAIGGLFFMASDALLGVNWFYQPQATNLVDFLVMLTYLIAQTLLVWGTLATVRSRHATEGAAEPDHPQS